MFQNYMKEALTLFENKEDYYDDHDKPNKLTKKEANDLLISASKSNDFKNVKKAVESGADKLDDALHWAADGGDYDSVVFLVDRGANVSSMHEKALRFASAEGHVDVVKYLISKGAKIYNDDLRPIEYAIDFGELDVVKVLIENGAKVYESDIERARESKAYDVEEYLKNYFNKK